MCGRRFVKVFVLFFPFFNSFFIFFSRRVGDTEQEYSLESQRQILCRLYKSLLDEIENKVPHVYNACRKITYIKDPKVHVRV